MNPAFPFPKRVLWILGAVFVLDQASKLAVQATMEPGQSIPLLPNFFLTFVHNPGGAFSLLADSPAWVRRPLLLLVPLGALWVGFQYLKSLPSKDTLSQAALGLVGGGALGNLLDRIRLGQVVDFFHVDIPTGAAFGWLGAWVPTYYAWPIFNVADSAVLCGIVLLGWRLARPLPGGNTPESKEADASHSA